MIEHEIDPTWATLAVAYGVPVETRNRWVYDIKSALRQMDQYQAMVAAPLVAEFYAARHSDAGDRTADGHPFGAPMNTRTNLEESLIRKGRIERATNQPEGDRTLEDTLGPGQTEIGGSE